MRRRLFASGVSMPARCSVAATVLGLLLAGGCSSSRPPVSDDDVLFPTDAAAQFTGPDGALQCQTSQIDGGPCGCLEISLISNQPNLYFVLDHSGSMQDDNKWTTVRQVVSNVVQKIGPRGKFGIAIFPDPLGGDNSCVAGKQVMPLRVGDSPAGTAGITTNLVIDTTSVQAVGGTPTAATFIALAPSLEGFSGKTYVILATDGAPNCDADASCDVSACSYNVDNDTGCPTGGSPNCCDPSANPAGFKQGCIDTGPTVSAIAALKAQNILTYVIGLPGSAPYSSVLDQFATAGGTARAIEPLYYSVTTTDATALETQLAQIAAKITATCTFPLSPPPQDPSKINVYFDNVVVPKDPVNGWTYDDETATLTLVGSACNEVLSGQVLNLRVIGGCPTVAPR
ncbi:MAG: vWA domain-containing protein [Polyangiaceae bacterium]